MQLLRKEPRAGVWSETVPEAAANCREMGKYEVGERQSPWTGWEALRKRCAADDTGLSGKSVEGSSPDGEEMERAWQQGERMERRLEVHEQLLALRHWLDAVEKRLPTLPEPGPALQVSLRAGPVLEEAAGAERAQDTLESLLAWVADMEELVSNQKPPSAEVKVAKAQLEEQKLLKRLLEERRPRVELILQDRPVPPAHGSGTAAAEGSGSLSGLAEKWGKLMQEAEARYGRLERILPAAQGFQEAVDSFQEWLGATERQLAQLWHANGCVSRVQDAHRQTQALCEEIRGRLGELDGTLESGQRVLEMVTGKWGWLEAAAAGWGPRDVGGDEHGALPWAVPAARGPLGAGCPRGGSAPHWRLREHGVA
ncbi:microtubule-actin cross-linking factor 1, isoforms 6/7-like [Theristicus caerulescens]